MMQQTYKQIINYANNCSATLGGVPLSRRLRFTKSLQWQLRQSAAATLCYCKIITILATPFGRMADILDESVSLLSLYGNLENFKASRRSKTFITCVAIYAVHGIFHTGVGCCLFDAWSSRTSVQINERLHTFCFIIDF